jgi:predicted alpha/beta-hydrolase family hydrolase
LVEAAAQFEQVKIPLPEPVHDLETVSGTLGIPEWWPTGSRISVVLAHGSQKDDPLLEGLQRELTQRKYLTLRFAFPFVESGRKKADPIGILQRTYTAALAILGRDPTAAPAHVFIGGKNLGALAAAHAAAARARVDGLFFLGYPLHKQDDPSQVRAERLFRIINPMLFIQGTRDRHCDLPTLRRTLMRVGAPWQLHTVEEADHFFRVSKKSGRSTEQVQAEVLAAVDAWIRKTLGEG